MQISVDGSKLVNYTTYIVDGYNCFTMSEIAKLLKLKMTSDYQFVYIKMKEGKEGYHMGVV